MSAVYVFAFLISRHTAGLVHLDHKEPQVLFCKAAIYPVHPKPVLLCKVRPSSIIGITFFLVDFQEVSVGSFLQSCCQDL